jgi:hypothetical protein
VWYDGHHRQVYTLFPLPRVVYAAIQDEKRVDIADGKLSTERIKVDEVQTKKIDDRLTRCMGFIDETGGEGGIERVGRMDEYKNNDSVLKRVQI